MRCLTVVVGTALLVAACSSSHHASPPTTSTVPTLTGTIVGRMLFEGGPLMADGHSPPASPITGVVAITRASDGVVTARVATDRNGRFRMTVPAGDYDVRGTSPNISGPLETSVSVRAGTTANAMLTVMAT